MMPRVVCSHGFLGQRSLRPERSASCLALLLLLAGAAEAAAPRIELYTMGRGDELFTMWGHAAICVVDPEVPGGGLCYNYGTTDFSRPIGLSWDVVRGEAEFWVSVSDRPSMILGFEADRRTIYRQLVPLPAERAFELALHLDHDAAPENRVYIYNHFLDNCSTRPRDLIDAASGGALRALDFAEGYTYRHYAAEGLGSASWVLVPGSDYLMGRWVDQQISTYDAMFVPSVLREGVERAFGARPEVVYRRSLPEPSADVRGARRLAWLVVWSFLAALAISARAGAFRIVAFGPLLLTGLGALLFFAALVSRLPELEVNELLAVFLPLDFLLLSSRARVAAVYASFRVVALAVVAALAALGWFVQPLWPFWTLALGVVMIASLATRWHQRRPRAA